jgi:hypothetical protein
VTRDDRETTEYQCSQAGYECKAARSREIAGEGQRGHGRARQTRFAQREALPARHRDARRDGNQRQEKWFMKAHMALVAMCAGISQEKSKRQALLKDLG